MTDPLVLSASSISEWFRCHRKYLYSSVYRVPGAQSMAAALGSAVHEAVWAFWKSPLKPTEVLRRRFEQELENVPEPYEEKPAGVLADGRRLLGTYIARVVPNFLPTMVEENFMVGVKEVPGVLLTGTIDAADSEDVHDLKTVALISKFRVDGADTQLSIYALGFEAMTGRKPKRLLLDVLPRGGQVSYRQIERKPNVGDLIDILTIMRDGVNRGDYSPTGAANGSCTWCAYKEICKYARFD